MITEELIRGEFMHQIMSRDSRFIYDTQARVLRENFTGEPNRKHGKLPLQTSGADGRWRHREDILLLCMTLPSTPRHPIEPWRDGPSSQTRPL